MGIVVIQHIMTRWYKEARGGEGAVLLVLQQDLQYGTLDSMTFLNPCQ
jgi:hypothetical protein